MMYRLYALAETEFIRKSLFQQSGRIALLCRNNAMNPSHYLCSRWGEIAMTGSFALVAAVVIGAL